MSQILFFPPPIERLLRRLHHGGKIKMAVFWDVSRCRLVEITITLQRSNLGDSHLLVFIPADVAVELILSLSSTHQSLIVPGIPKVSRSYSVEQVKVCGETKWSFADQTVSTLTHSWLLYSINRNIEFISPVTRVNKQDDRTHVTDSYFQTLK